MTKVMELKDINFDDSAQIASLANVSVEIPVQVLARLLDRYDMTNLPETNNVVLARLLKGVPDFKPEAKLALLELCDKLEKQPRRWLKDSQTYAYLDYENVDALIEQARKAVGVPHVVAKDPRVNPIVYQIAGPVIPEWRTPEVIVRAKEIYAKYPGAEDHPWRDGPSTSTKQEEALRAARKELGV